MIAGNQNIHLFCLSVCDDDLFKKRRKSSLKWWWWILFNNFVFFFFILSIIVLYTIMMMNAFIMFTQQRKLFFFIIVGIPDITRWPMTKKWRHEEFVQITIKNIIRWLIKEKSLTKIKKNKDLKSDWCLNFSSY